ncbi:uncharacterized protein LOC132053209 [Lycium ferocissimum]|uniref:uncharacterized protein LOC132053209 n=1 Tax=Lycium ferocissimum TaxID=112874 RepID=UPI0028159BE7|nr:uncharacterized protein LOC132053209 [Lycium ferocissimum]
MAFLQYHHQFPLLLLFFFLFLSLALSSPMSIHDLLKSKGLPSGLLPKEVKSYNYSSSNGLLEVYLDGPCLTKLDTMAFYESYFKANLTYGCLNGVHGLSQEELFVWLPVKGIVVDDINSGIILFDIGLAHKQLSLSLFEDPPHCNPDGILKKNTGRDRYLKHKDRRDAL